MDIPAGRPPRDPPPPPLLDVRDAIPDASAAAEDTADDDDGVFVELLADFGCDDADIVTLFEMVGGACAGCGCLPLLMLAAGAAAKTKKQSQFAYVSR